MEKFQKRPTNPQFEQTKQVFALSHQIPGPSLSETIRRDTKDRDGKENNWCGERNERLSDLCFVMCNHQFLSPEKFLFNFFLSFYFS